MLDARGNVLLICLNGSGQVGPRKTDGLRDKGASCPFAR